MEHLLSWCQLAGIYTASFASAALLVMALVPELRERVTAYLSRSTVQAGKRMENMFMNISAMRLRAAYVLAPVALAGLGGLVLGIPIGLAGGLGLGLVLPTMVMNTLHRRRQQRFRSQLVDTLMILSSSLKAGLNILQSFEVLAEEMPTPCSQEFGLLIKEIKMGMAIDEALNRLLARMPSPDLQLIVTAVLVARETGGDVTGVFSRLVETIRERQKIKEKVKTLTTMPRAQGVIMALLPIGFSMLVYSFDAKFFDVFLHDPLGQLVGMVIMACWVLSLVLIWFFGRPPLIG